MVLEWLFSILKFIPFREQLIIRERHTPKQVVKELTKKRNELLKEHFLHVLDTQIPYYVENAGFIEDTRGVIKTYTQKK